jgi:hypothetical protein
VLRLNHFDACPDALPTTWGTVVTTLAHDCSVPEIDCLGRTLHMTAELLAHFAYRREQRADRILNLKIKNTKRGKPIPHNRQTPAPPIPKHGQSSRIRTRRASLVA